MAITKAGDERGTMAIAIITADVTRGGKALLLQAVGQARRLSTRSSTTDR